MQCKIFLHFSIPVLSGRHSIPRPKLSVKVRQVPESHLFGNGYDLIFRLSEKPGGNRQSSLIQIHHKTASRHLLEPPHEMTVAASAVFCDFRDTDLSFIMCLNKLEHFL